MPKKAEPVAPKKPEVPAVPLQTPQPKSVHETYQVIKRGDSYVVEVTLYGRVFHDIKTYPYQSDAEKRLAELSKAVK